MGYTGIRSSLARGHPDAVRTTPSDGAIVSGRPIEMMYSTGDGLLVNFRYSSILNFPVDMRDPAVVKGWVITAGIITLAVVLNSAAA